MGVARYFDHVALAVAPDELERALTLFIDVLGFEFVGGGDNAMLEVRAIQLRLPHGAKVELLSPNTETSYLKQYIERHGQGFHHLTMYADDVEGAAATLDAAGFPTVDTSTEHDTWHETFVRPSTAEGALVQLARPLVPWDEPLVGVTVEDVMAGRVGIRVNEAWWIDTGEPLVPANAAVDD